MQDPLKSSSGGGPGSGGLTGGAPRGGLAPGANPGAGQPSGGPNPAAVGPSGVRSAGGPIGGMMGAGGAGHGRNAKDDEGEHQIPKFLVNMDNTRKLVGPLPDASPAVIGDWDAHERDDPDFQR